MKVYTCSKHNYSGIDCPCPDCHPIEAANYAARQVKITYRGLFAAILVIAIVYIILFIYCVAVK